MINMKNKKLKFCTECLSLRLKSISFDRPWQDQTVEKLLNLACSPVRTGKQSFAILLPLDSTHYQMKFCKCGNSIHIVCKGEIFESVLENQKIEDADLNLSHNRKQNGNQFQRKNLVAS